jgi:hypothetical protein
MKKQTRQDRIFELINAVNAALEARNSPDRILYKGAFGQAGLDRATAKNPTQPERPQTGYMPKNRLIEYLETMLTGIYMIRK